MELTGRQRIYLQHCHNIWQWIREGHGASSFLETSKGQLLIEELRKFFNLSQMHAENKYLQIYDAIDYLAAVIDRDGMDSPVTQKAKAELTSKFDIFNSTLIGSIIGEEIERDIKEDNK